MTGLSTPPAVYTPDPAPGFTLSDADHDEGLHETDRTAIRALILEAWALALPLTINGNMDHFQRWGSGTTVPTTTYSTNTSYAADRFFVLPAGASLTSAGRSTTVPDGNSRYSLEIVGAASVTTVDIGQRIAAGLVQTRGRQSLVFSAYVYNGSGSAFTPNLRVGTPSAADDFTTVTNRLDQALQSCADGEWTRVYHVFDPSAYTNIANGMEVCLRVPSGSLVAGDTVRISQFDLRPGAALAPYIAPDRDLELLRALRYFETITYSANLERLGVGSASSTAIVRWVQPWRVRKRGVPAIRFSDNSHIGTHSTTDTSTLHTGTLVTSGGTGLDSAGLAITSVATSPLTTGAAHMVSWANSAGYIHVDAEL